MATINDVALGDFIIHERQWCRIVAIQDCSPSKNWWERTPAEEHREVFEKYKELYAGKPLQAIPHQGELSPLLYPASFVDAVLTLEAPDGSTVTKGLHRSVQFAVVPAPQVYGFSFVGLEPPTLRLLPITEGPIKKPAKKTTKKATKKTGKKKAKKKGAKKKASRRH